MPATRAEWIELFSPTNGGDYASQQARYAKVYGLVREYLTTNFVLDASTGDVVEALFPTHWTLDDAGKFTQSKLFGALTSQSAKRKLAGCCRQAGEPNKWGRLPKLWSSPPEQPEPTPAKCCPTCGKAL